ncbi:TetR/AcrR family transcriptional regulator [Flexivirga caeni]|uniref:TetR family transcriptional regulator n=1 Tax=Flexivirga caeni TaxID=2294115 RepID=A0A3M9MEG3_9MICO|nr:TetR family transcriptional regulator [Flexivirga caeni]RNI23223.1 TetR family transcriptional regulator [Flexivirga caeni]
MTDTKTKLLDASLDVLRTDGVAGASARVIASRAGVNQALVFYHFGTLDGLLTAAARHAVDERADHYRQLFAEVDSLSALLQVGRELHETEQASGNVAVMAQLMAGGQRDPELAAAARYSMDRWVAEVEQVIDRVLESTVLADVAEARGLARAVCASFIGLELYDGVDPDGGAAALDALTQLAVLADTIDGLGPVARRAVSARLKGGARRTRRDG